MIESEVASRICDWMVEKYPQLGQIAVDELKKWRSSKVPYAYPEILDRHLEEAHREILTAIRPSGSADPLGNQMQLRQ